ncbi:MAG: hypothetical protein UR26_C0006G0014 [candidate division TM6 bacterium GW2011_GWF2_32_72]|nr:MAG: hypothetical protein UR26_C0006G0014 [candidate division TM6 bacterium GW2011_GWF2_32_72]
MWKIRLFLLFLSFYSFCLIKAENTVDEAGAFGKTWYSIKSLFFSEEISPAELKIRQKEELRKAKIREQEREKQRKEAEEKARVQAREKERALVEQRKEAEKLERELQKESNRQKMAQEKQDKKEARKVDKKTKNKLVNEKKDESVEPTGFWCSLFSKPTESSHRFIKKEDQGNKEELKQEQKDEKNKKNEEQNLKKLARKKEKEQRRINNEAIKKEKKLKKDAEKQAREKQKELNKQVKESEKTAKKQKQQELVQQKKEAVLQLAQAREALRREQEAIRQERLEKQKEFEAWERKQRLQNDIAYNIKKETYKTLSPKEKKLKNYEIFEEGYVMPVSAASEASPKGIRYVRGQNLFKDSLDKLRGSRDYNGRSVKEIERLLSVETEIIDNVLKEDKKAVEMKIKERDSLLTFCPACVELVYKSALEFAQLASLRKSDKKAEFLKSMQRTLYTACDQVDALNEELENLLHAGYMSSN